jgi:pilus assembly protein Flp/PilA
MRTTLPLKPDSDGAAQHACRPNGPFLRFLRDSSGATAVEYGLIAALISVTAIATLKGVGSKLNTKLTTISNGLN